METPALPQEILLAEVARRFQLAPHEISGRRRTPRVSQARHIIMWILREVFHWSYGEIGIFLGNRDHSTAIYGCEQIQNRVEDDDDFGRNIRELREFAVRLYNPQPAA